MGFDYKQAFLEFQDQLRSYLYRLLTNRQEAEDLCQDTFIKVCDKIEQFQGKSSFKTWVFAIATNLAKDRARAKERWGTNWMDLVRDAHVVNPALMQKKQQIVQDSPHFKFVISEHLNYCFTCTSKTLLLTQQMCLWLKDVYDFKLSEIMLILNLSEGKVKHALAEARKDMARIFEHKCALINKKGICGQCTGLNKIFNPQQDAQMEANRLKMVKERRNKNYEQLLALRLQIVKGLDPLVSEGIDLHNYLLEHSPQWAKQQQKQTTGH